MPIHVETGSRDKPTEPERRIQNAKDSEKKIVVVGALRSELGANDHALYVLNWVLLRGAS